MTQNRTCRFGPIVEGVMILNDAGKVVDQVCQEVPKIIKNVAFDIYQIMPKHLHAIIE